MVPGLRITIFRTIHLQRILLYHHLPSPERQLPWHPQVLIVRSRTMFMFNSYVKLPENYGYPLVNCYITMENHHAING